MTNDFMFASLLGGLLCALGGDGIMMPIQRRRGLRLARKASVAGPMEGL